MLFSGFSPEKKMLTHFLGLSKMLILLCYKKEERSHPGPFEMCRLF